MSDLDERVMVQVLLRNNRRASAALAAIGAVPMIMGGLIVGALGSQSTSIIAIFGWLLMAAGGLLTFWQLRFMVRPRLACSPNELLVYLGGTQPVRVPLDSVECFFLGQAPTTLGQTLREEIETSTVVVRLAERATDWHQRDVKKRLGHWCDGYIIIHGTWCEPLSRDVVSRMNSQLAQVKRTLKVKQA